MLLFSLYKCIFYCYTHALDSDKITEHHYAESLPQYEFGIGNYGTGVFAPYYVFQNSGTIEGDYSCLFRAIAHQLERPISDSDIIRQELVLHLRDHAQDHSDLVSIGYRLC